LSTSTDSYLAGLATRLAEGLDLVGEGFRTRHASWLRQAQHPDGGFAGRAGPPDLYYTAFGLRAAAALGTDEPEPWCRAAGFLAHHDLPVRTVVDALCLCESALILQQAGIPKLAATALPVVRDVLDACRTDGGYASEPGAPASLYHTFLATACRELIGDPIGGTEDWLAKRIGRQTPDGGIGDSDGSGVAGTNPTAAALILLTRSADAPADVVDRTSAFLAGMQQEDGGFAAHAAAPESDLLSTFTAVAALSQAERLGEVRMPEVGRFIRTLAGADGGFRASGSDDTSDVEYTYYGVGVAGLLGAHVVHQRRTRCDGPGCCCLPRPQKEPS